MEERIFGKISFPGPQVKVIENIWLTITSTSIFLEIPWNGFGHETWSIIHGKFIGMDEVTFIGARIGGGISGGESSYRRLHVTAIVKGVHLQSVDDLVFNELNLESPALMNWITEPHYVETDHSGNYKLPDVLKVIDGTFDDFDLLITLGHAVNSSFRAVDINQRCMIKVSFKENIHWNLILDRVYLLKKFILFITNSDPSFSFMALSTSAGGYEVIIPMKKLDESNFSQNILCSYPSLKNHIPAILKLWFEQSKIQPIIDLLLEKYFNTNLSMPRHFQNVCIALETYHEKFIDRNVALVDSSKLTNRQLIVEKLSDDESLKQWFETESSFWSKPNLIDRLVQFKSLIQRLIDDTIDCDIDDLLNKIKQTRNEITHQGISNKRFNSIELILTAKTIEFAVKLDILRFCKVDIDVIHNSLIEDGKMDIQRLATLNYYYDLPNRIKRQ
jgi:phosphoribosyl-AMP cyclohydrolase